MKRTIAFMIVALICALAVAQKEGVLNKLLAPGPLIKGHADLEGKDCFKCHDVGKGAPDADCLSCHKEIKPFVEKHRGFHGLSTKHCAECHSDHKGRDFNSIAIDVKTFKHAEETGYKLEGHHAELKCEKCHEMKMGAKSVLAGKTRYFGRQTTCVACHKKDDPHAFKGKWAKKDCNACHGQKTWKEDIRFDHWKDTRFKLEGKHAELSCKDCHGPNKKTRETTFKTIYKWPRLKKAQCLACHEDFHKDRLSARFRGGACLKCHNQTKWEIKEFDHSVTGYPLHGKHAELKCIECHTQGRANESANAGGITLNEIKNFKFTGLRKQCISCHEDIHRYGPHNMPKYGLLTQCSQCHLEKTWKETPNFEHNKDTRYVIDGEHLALKCSDCHLPKNKRLRFGIYKWPKLKTKTCENCHANVHLKEFSPKFLKKACDECHVTSGWHDQKNGMSFDHTKTRFPLTGKHKETRCSDCHGTHPKQVFKFQSADVKFCVDCHSNVHTHQFSNHIHVEDCASCHNTTNFRERAVLDHSKFRYPLEGAHGKVKCEECHQPSTSTITLYSPNVAKKQFPRGSSLRLSQFLFPNVSKEECFQCHVDYHNSQLGPQCLSCHDMNQWKSVKFDHNSQSQFPLRGKHEQVKCKECHKPIANQFVHYKNQSLPVTQYKPIKSECFDCHKDPHKGEFGNRCTECHTERDWKVTKDFHKNFTLTGVHYTLECAECHKEGRKLSGLSQQCMFCHAKDDIHNGTQPHCETCHRQQFWEVSGFKHSLTMFPLRGAHRVIECMDCHNKGIYKGLNPSCRDCHVNKVRTPLPTIPEHNPPIQECSACHNDFTFQRL